MLLPPSLARRRCAAWPTSQASRCINLHPTVWAIGECAGSRQFTQVSFDNLRIVRDNLAGRVTTHVPYCLCGGHVERYDDLPAQYQDNVNREPPFDRKPGEAPALSKDEIEDVIAFLKTLTDADLAGTLASAPPT
jgi:hypothetical protein